MSSMAHVVMLLTNGFGPDPRVAREAEVLAQAGYQVTVVCWDRKALFPAVETYKGYRVERVQTVRSRYGAGMKQMLRLPAFWSAAAERVGGLHPDLLHAHDLDTLPLGAWLKRRCGAPLVYDAHEDYPAMMSLYLPGPLIPALGWLERRLLSRVDHTLTPGMDLADRLRRRGAKHVTTVGNYQPLEPFDALTEADVIRRRQSLGLSPEDLALVYIGGFSRNRHIVPMIEAARDLPGVKVLIWGDGHQRSAVEAAVAQAPNARYLGWLPAEQVPLHARVADAIYYCLTPDHPGVVCSAPNTLSIAMAAGRPIIANDVGDLGRIVRETGCGWLLQDGTVASIREAIEALRDPALRLRLGRAGRTAAGTRYSWRAASEQLLKVYATLCAGLPYAGDLGASSTNVQRP